MRLIVVEQDLIIYRQWLEVVQPPWLCAIEQFCNNQEALCRLKSPYFFPIMVCQADRATILRARDHGVQRFVIGPCEPVQVIQEIGQYILANTDSNTRDAQVQLQVMNHMLNSLCHGPVTYRQLQWLKQRCTGEHLSMARAAIDQVLRYMDRPNHKMTEIKSALMELSMLIQMRVGRVLAPHYA